MTKKEKDLYQPIEDLFKRKGYFSITDRKRLPSERVHSPFGVNVYGINKRIDAVAFKWRGDIDIEAQAVECKSGKTWQSVGEALGQATAYQRVFPEVYVASEVDENKLGHVDSLLRQLGLGYIRINENEAEEIFPPSQNIRYNQKEFERQVKVKAAILLAYREVFGKKFQFGRANEPGFIWTSTLGRCNVVLAIEQDTFWHALNLERKKDIEMVFSKMDEEELYRLISRLPPQYYVWLGHFKIYRPKTYVWQEEKQVSKLGKTDLATYIKKVKDWG